MFSIAALVPSPPILVPELCGAATGAVAGLPDDPRAELRAAVLAAARELAAVTDRWTVIGTGAADQVFGPGTVGTFRGFGADVRVALSASASAEPDPQHPLPILIAGWLREQVAPAVSAEVRVIDAATPTQRCWELGAKLRAELEGSDGRQGVLVVADGAATLSLKAPGYLDERAAAVQDELDRALREGDRVGLRALEPELCAELVMSGRAAYQVLAGLFDSDPAVETRYQAAPFGVGYDVSLWRPAGRRE
ncbi:hypothetical protein [Nocardia tenerifensis]|uniref:hypothetical protein n=1 Tax=Nocardia tenerifensis TaxID=228006 RepID=UPI000592FB88|nr:hypothetical protein [Nocardia tenerifensis]